ncbi:MAG: helix-turn-helix transcriptional regulator [Lachnospiraceae bacterium]|nr:helix-turn-helix transcriptional regulator [Lachnospiraceae bacterium]
MKYQYTYDVKEFGNRLRAIRKKNGYTQEQLADLLLLSVDSISNMENGKTTCMPEHMMKICQIFNVSADYFYFSMDKELLQKEARDIDSLVKLLQACSDVDYSKIYRIIKIMLESLAA